MSCNMSGKNYERHISSMNGGRRSSEYLEVLEITLNNLKSPIQGSMPRLISEWDVSDYLCPVFFEI